MKLYLVKPSFEIRRASIEDLNLIEESGRICYKSGVALGELAQRNKFIAARIRTGHESILEHSLMTVKFICDRGVSHELVRHRLCSFSQESTRYCNYAGGVTFIIPPWVDVEPGEYDRLHYPTVMNRADGMWVGNCMRSESDYLELLLHGWLPQQARSALNHSVKTEIIVSGNFREWRHILALRALGTTGKPHPQMTELMVPLLESVKNLIPAIFEDLDYAT